MARVRIPRPAPHQRARSKPRLAYPLATLYGVQLLLTDRLWHALATQPGGPDDSVLHLLGLALMEEAVTPAGLHEHLLALHAQLADEDLEHPEPMQGNLERLATLLCLDDTEVALLALLVYREELPGVEEVLTLNMSAAGQSHFARRLSQALGLPLRAVLGALSGRGRLSQTGLMSAGRHEPFVLNKGLGDAIVYHPGAEDLVLRSYSCVAAAAELAMTDFDQLGALRDTLVHYLRHALRSGAPGINILLHGEPGTGKTQLARALSEEMGATLHEILCADAQDLPVAPERRFAAYRFCQSILAGQSASLLLFDECEDVFARGDSIGRKAWVNRLLENNPRPALWLCNDIGWMDPAFIRRFDLVIEMPPLGVEQRRNMARARLADVTVSDEWLERIASRESLQAAHLATAAKVASAIEPALPGGAESVIEQVLGGLGNALGLSLIAPVVEPARVSSFDPLLSNTDADLAQLVAGMQKSRIGRLCLYGPPGTGKSEFARYLASELGQPLVCRKASDLLHPYVGQTEQAIAAAFNEARQRNGILLIDEVDSLLFARSMSLRSWEVSQVNELLQQMEHFQGILIMTSNHLKRVDHAALRRFDLKIHFDYLTAEQARRFFIRAMDRQALRLEGDFLKRSLQALQLTPGDFQTVLRRFQVMGQSVSEVGLIQGLRQEHELRNQHASLQEGW